MIFSIKILLLKFIFIENYIDKCQYLSFIIPSRWMYKNSLVKSFKKFMMKRNDIVFINFISNTHFVGVDLSGGFNYFLKDSNYQGKVKLKNGMYDIKDIDNILFDVPFKINNNILKLFDFLTNKKKLTDIYGVGFKIMTNDKRLSDNYDENKYVCYVNLQQSKDRIKYIEKDVIDSIREKEMIKKYKVITVHAYNNRVFGFTCIIKPNEIYNQSYVSFYVNSEKEANSLLSYLNCKLPKIILVVNKRTQYLSKDTIENIPLPPLDRIWNDEEVYNYFNILKFKDTIDFIYQGNRKKKN